LLLPFNMPRFLKLAVVFALVVFACSAWAMFRVARLPRGRSGPGTDTAAEADITRRPPLPGLSIPDFTLIDQNGEPFTRRNLEGRITVVNFVFTHCPFVCPTLMEKMAGLSIALKDEPVRFLSISVDPARDTPEALRAFAKLHSADKESWTLVTGDEAEVDRIVAEGLLFALVDDPTTPITLPDGSSMSNVVHPSWFVLLGPDVEVKSLYRPDDASNLEVLVKDVRRLAGELPRPSP